MSGGGRRCLTGALIAGLMAPALFASAAHAAFPGKPGKIAFDSDRTGSRNIYTVNEDGSGLTQLTFDVGEEGPGSFAPAWSPDGTRIVYAHNDQGGNSDIWVMNADGSGKTNLTPSLTTQESDPSFSFDGSRIVFSSFGFTDFDDDVLIMNANGTGITQLTNDSGANQPNDSHPVFSQDGTIYFDSNRDGTFTPQVFAMNADGSNQRPLTSGPGASSEPDPSPDGATIVFSSNRLDPENANRDLFLMNRDGTGIGAISTTPNENESRPAFSPGSLRVVFEDTVGQLPDIALRGTGGGATQLLASSDGFDEAPDWQPVQYHCFGRVPTIVGSYGNDAIVGTPGPDTIVGLGGNDQIKGTKGDDRLCGDYGRDKIFGGKGDDLLAGGPGSDQLFGGAGLDKLFGGSPNADVNEKGDRNKCVGGKGDDKAGVDCNIKQSI